VPFWALSLYFSNKIRPGPPVRLCLMLVKILKRSYLLGYVKIRFLYPYSKIL
jgi:hypothetical protein